MNAHPVPHVRVGGVCDASASEDVGRRDRSDPELSALEDIGRVVEQDLDVLLRAQPRDVSSHENVKVVGWVLG